MAAKTIGLMLKIKIICNIIMELLFIWAKCADKGNSLCGNIRVTLGKGTLMLIQIGNGLYLSHVCHF